MKRAALVAIVLGASLLGGAISGWLVSSYAIAPELRRLEDRIAERPAASTTTVPVVQIVPIETRAVSGDGAIILRRRSPVLTVVRKAGPKDDKVVTAEREAGAAVALTSDGWLAAPASLFAGHRAADLLVVWNGSTHPIERAIRDTATDAVFLKIAATDLPVTALVRASDVQDGASVWMETRPRRVLPLALADVRVRAGADPITSERASRRFLLPGSADALSLGAAVWDGRGQLVGVVDAKAAEGARVLPAGDLAAALSALLASGKITHASLGVRATDLGVSIFDDRAGLPAQGAWVRSVLPNGSSASLLKEGDVILRVERDILDGTADLGERLLDYRPGTEVTLTVLRDGKEVTVPITLGEAVTGEPVR